MEKLPLRRFWGRLAALWHKNSQDKVVTIQQEAPEQRTSYSARIIYLYDLKMLVEEPKPAKVIPMFPQVVASS